jgi:hypothetical protein
VSIRHYWRAHTESRIEKREMAPALINANPVVHEKKERSAKPQADYNDFAPDVIDELEIFDILSQLVVVVKNSINLASLRVLRYVRNGRDFSGSR